MTADINEGSVPSYYREVHQAICSRTDERVPLSVFQRVLSRTSLSITVQNQIAEHVNSGDGFLSKVSLYKGLALIALAQQGKPPSPKLLENFIQEFPKPQLGEPRELQSLKMQTVQESPLNLSLALGELLKKDTIKVELIPEKKGLFLKHVEYQVTSERFTVSVYRRYTDFDVFHELLLQRYAYRVVPALPPKRALKGDFSNLYFHSNGVPESALLCFINGRAMFCCFWKSLIFSLFFGPAAVLTSMSEREFIEGRRRALGRFLNLVARHPVFSEDELVKTFLTFSGSDVQTKLRDACKKLGDEFMTCKYATQAKDYLPADIQSQFSSSRELIKNIHNSFQKLRDRAERMAERSKENATDLLMFGKELSSLGSDESPVPILASCKSPWAALRRSVKGLSVEFSLLSEKAAQQGRREEDDVVEKLNLFLDLLQSYRDLCERHEKGVLHEHQRALQKYGVMKRQILSATVQPKEQVSVEQLESRIVQQENAIQAMELRNYFSLFCLHQESQLIFTYLPITSHILGAFVNSQVQGHKEMGEVWQDLHSKLKSIFGDGNGQSPPLSPK
ncbi:sorting nexin-8a isoform X1 [Sinocyclocheilus rhinocerous]|uniref:sorting nexin-8a isoform X1 n=1 Tax=Sinocyclocheilus rhinocerous TaxID=307959 RepID=UPI0007B7C017|nr:PREDICTED: sorting nexin-8 isoform X1 [Sinocyclocheilus rhinocerous]